MSQTTPKILIVDDEADIREILQFNLEHEGFSIVSAVSAEEALPLIDSSFSLIILDVMMEGMSGFKMADLLRKQGSEIPIIFLTAKNTENDMLTGFSIGGDDYVKKPFSVKELIARVRSVLRRGAVTDSPSPMVIQKGDLRIDTQAMSISVGDQTIDATKTEYDILVLLISHEGRVFSRSEILDAVWQDNGIVLERTVDVHIARLRKKLGQASRYIHNRVGFGYTFKTTIEE